MKTPAVVSAGGGACPNCDAPLQPQARFCSGCGQRTHFGPRTLRETMQDTLGRDYAPDGRLWLTLRALAVPGRLTADWFAGRQQRYLGPARLFLLTLFIAIVAVQGQMRLVVPVEETGADGAGPATRLLRVGTSLGGAPPLLVHGYAHTRLEVHAGLLTPWLHPLAERARLTLARQAEADFRQRLRSVVVPARFNGRTLAVPLLIALLALVHVGQRRLLAEHTVFALHVESTLVLVAVLLLAPLELWAQSWDLFAGAMVLFTLVWVPLAMRRYYGAPWPATLARATALLACAHVASAHLDAMLTLWALG